MVCDPEGVVAYSPGFAEPWVKEHEEEMDPSNSLPRNRSSKPSRVLAPVDTILLGLNVAVLS